METDDPITQVKAAAAIYKRTKTAHEKAQAALADAVVAALRAGKRPADVARASEWDREYNRRLKAKADEAEAAARKRPVDPAPPELGVNPLVNAITRGRLDQLDNWLQAKRAAWYAEQLVTTLATVPAEWRKHVVLSEAVAAGHIRETDLGGRAASEQPAAD